MEPTETMPEPGDWLSLDDAAALLPGSPGRVTVWRWCRRGVRTRGGTRRHLGHVRLGRRLFTRKAWLMDFAREVAAADQAAMHADDRRQRACAARQREKRARKRTRRRLRLRPDKR